MNIYDPGCETGGMLTIAEDYFKAHNEDPSSSVMNLYGQDVNEEIYAICRSDLMIKGQNPENIRFGNSFSDDCFENEYFDYMLSNPPFGVNWKKVQKVVKEEYESRGFDGRFGAGLPSISDGPEFRPIFTGPLERRIILDPVSVNPTFFPGQVAVPTLVEDTSPMDPSSLMIPFCRAIFDKMFGLWLKKCIFKSA